MSWYAAHLVMIVKQKGQQQRRFPAWENIVLIKAASQQSAITKAEVIGAACARDDDGTFEWGGKPATWEFLGVRKVAECALAKNDPASGDEISYQELEFHSLADAKRYARGAAMSVMHNDQIRIVDDAELTTMSRPKRKRA
jgi:hypothetical protein